VKSVESIVQQGGPPVGLLLQGALVLPVLPPKGSRQQRPKELDLLVPLIVIELSDPSQLADPSDQHRT